MRVLLVLLFLELAAAIAFAKDIQFARRKIQLGSMKFMVEIADTEEKRARGLMQRKSMPEMGGMLFIFEEARPVQFWMKDTLISLDIGYFGKDAVLFQVLKMEPASPIDLSPKLYPSSAPVRYALEMNLGWFTRHHIKAGAKLKLP